MACKEYLESAEKWKNKPYIEFEHKGRKVKFVFAGERTIKDILKNDIVPRLINQVLAEDYLKSCGTD